MSFIGPCNELEPKILRNAWISSELRPRVSRLVRFIDVGPSSAEREENNTSSREEGSREPRRRAVSSGCQEHSSDRE